MPMEMTGMRPNVGQLLESTEKDLGEL